MNKTNRRNRRHKKMRKTHKKGGTQKINCSPVVENKTVNASTCYTPDVLIKIKDAYNKSHSKDEYIPWSNPQEIWRTLNKRLVNCAKEDCWLSTIKDKQLAQELKDVIFAPEHPPEWLKNPNEWLTDLDISNVMKQYEEAYKCFEFIGPSPIDYDTHKLYGECVWEELCHFSLEDQIKNGKMKIGVIFNLDPHNKGGSHWVSLFINIKKKAIFFFDSAGEQIPSQIMKFVNTVKTQGQQLKTPIHFAFDQNYPVEHQYGNTECGIYSLYFIVHMLDDKITGHYLKTHIMKDEYMEKFRKVYFNDDL